MISPLVSSVERSVNSMISAPKETAVATEMGRIIAHCAIILGASTHDDECCCCEKTSAVIACAEKCFVRRGIAKAKLMQNPIPMTAMKRLASVTVASKRSITKWATKRSMLPKPSPEAGKHWKPSAGRAAGMHAPDCAVHSAEKEVSASGQKLSAAVREKEREAGKNLARRELLWRGAESVC